MMVNKFYEKLFSEDTPIGLRQVLSNIFRLYGLWNLEKHQASLFQGEFVHHCFYFERVINLLENAD